MIPANAGVDLVERGVSSDLLRDPRECGGRPADRNRERSELA